MKKYLSITNLFVVAIVLRFPLIWLLQESGILFEVFSTASFSLLALLAIFFNPEKVVKFFKETSSITRWLFYVIAILCTSILLNYIFLNFNNRILLTSLGYVLIPLIGAVFYRKFSRVIPLLFSALGAVNFIFIMISLKFDANSLPKGLSGNINWSATLLVCGALCIGYYIKKSHKSIIISVISMIILLFMFFGANISRGTIFAIVATLFVVSLAMLKRHRKKVFIGALILFLGGVLFLFYQKSSSDIVRKELIYSTMKVIQENPWYGHGSLRFESLVAPYITEEYHLLDVAASRHPHPHNQILFLTTMFGIFGGIFLLSFAIMGYLSLRKWKNNNESINQNFICIILFFVLFTHGQVDVLLCEWPFHIVFLLLMGTVWGYLADNLPVNGKIIEIKLLKNRKIQLIMGGILIFLATAFIITSIKTALSSYYYRKTRVERHNIDEKTTRKYLSKSTSFMKTPENLYLYGYYALYQFNDAELTYDILSSIPKYTANSHHFRSNMFIGQSLAAQGKYAEALSYFNEEQRIFKLSIVNMTLKIDAEIHLNLNENVKKSKLQLQEILKKRKLKESVIPYIMNRTFLDFDDSKIPKEFKI